VAAGMVRRCAVAGAQAKTPAAAGQASPEPTRQTTGGAGAVGLGRDSPRVAVGLQLPSHDRAAGLAAAGAAGGDEVAAGCSEPWCYEGLLAAGLKRRLLVPRAALGATAGRP
jgi:hypothetical protein